MIDGLIHSDADDGIDRRGFLRCMAWAGTGLVLTMKGGVLKSRTLSEVITSGVGLEGDFSFVQVSDSHVGFNMDANKDVVGTFKTAVDRIAGAKPTADFLIHTGDISHLSKPEEFDAVEQILTGAHMPRVFYVPGEHDVLSENGKSYRERFGKGTKGDGWYSFDHKGCHFVGLVNVLTLKAGGMGSLGSDQIAWLEQDLKQRSTSTPIVVFAHIPLWTVYPQWGWGTEDSAQALSYLKRFGSVTVLNGHIHQVLQKVEGNITFHSASSTAFPQPKPGGAPSPGPLKVPAEELRKMLGLTRVDFVQGNHSLAVIDSSLDQAAQTVRR